MTAQYTAILARLLKMREELARELAVFDVVNDPDFRLYWRLLEAGIEAATKEAGE